MHSPQYLSGRRFDVCTCLGVMSLFDEIDQALANMLSLVRQKGSLFAVDLVNDYPVDVIMRYRIALEPGYTNWRAAFNMRSCVTYERAVSNIDTDARIRWADFQMPFAIPQRPDPLRAWTIRMEERQNQIVVGTGQLLNFKILQVIKE